MKRTWAVLGLFLAAGALAQGQGQGQGEGKWWKRPRIASELQLTPEQDAQLETIFGKSKPRLIDLRAALEKKQLDYDEAMRGDTTDRKAVEAKIEAREEARAGLQKELSLMELDMKQVLKPEQRERLMQLREQGRQRMQERRRRFRDGESDTDRQPRTDRQPHGAKRRAKPSPQTP
ncbi:MAG: periplasmic heavy metal sensor [Acidobacteriota bacterium]